MTRCKTPCVESNKYGAHDPYDVDLCHRKWNYVKNLYMGRYTIDEDGYKTDYRDTDDPARILDEDNWNAEFDTDYIDWTDYLNLGGAIERDTHFEKWLQWKNEVGTTAYGNLPQHKRHDHTGHCWMPCPYSTDSSDVRSETMWDVSDDPVLSKVLHGDAYMQTDSRGTVWGWTCTYSGCSYLLDSGTRYFYK